MAANIAGYLLDNALFEIWDYRNTGKVFSNVHLRSNGNLYMNTAGNLVGGSTYVTGNLIMSNASKTLSVAGDSSFNGNVTTSGTLSATGNLNSSGNLNVSGDSAFSGNVTTSGTLTATGNLNSSGNLNVSGTSYLYGNVFASNNMTVSGTLSATGNLNSSGNLNVSGTSYLSGNVLVTGTLSATGNLNSSGNLNVSGIANVSGNLYISGTSDFTRMVTMSNVLNVNGNLNANSNLIVSGTAYLGNIVTTGALSTLGVTNFTNTTESTSTTTGAITIAGGMGVAKNVNVGGNLAVTDTTTLSSTLNVSGITSVTSTVQSSSTSNGALVVSGGVGIANDVNIGGSLNVGQSSTLSNGLTVNNGATLNGGVVMNDGTTINSGIDINGGSLDIGTPTNTALYVSGGLFVDERGYIANTLQTTTEGTGAFIVKGGASIAMDLYVGGNLRIQGNTTFVDTEQVTVEDPLISLNQNNNLAFIQTQGGGLNFYATDSTEVDNIQGYLKTTGNGQDLSFKSVNSTINGIVTIKPHESLNSDVLVSNVRANVNQRIYNSNLVIDNKLALGGATLTAGNTLSVSGSASITNRLTLGELVLAKNDLSSSASPSPIPAVNGNVIGTVNGACGTIYANTLNIINTGEIVNFRVNNNFMDESRLVFVNVLSYDGGEFVPIVYCKSSNAGSFDLEVSCPYTFVNGNLFIKYMIV